MVNRAHAGGFCLLEGTGRVPKAAPAAGACGGGHRLGGNEVQVLVVWNLIQVIAILKQLPIYILVHLLKGGKVGTVSPDAKQRQLLPHSENRASAHAPSHAHSLPKLSQDYRKHHFLQAVPSLIPSRLDVSDPHPHPRGTAITEES